jgi:hypothetical protein
VVFQYPTTVSGFLVMARAIDLNSLSLLAFRSPPGLSPGASLLLDLEETPDGAAAPNAAAAKYQRGCAATMSQSSFCGCWTLWRELRNGVDAAGGAAAQNKKRAVGAGCEA